MTSHEIRGQLVTQMVEMVEIQLKFSSLKLTAKGSENQWLERSTVRGYVKFPGSTLPETNGSPLKIGLPNRKVVFVGAMLVSGRVYLQNGVVLFFHV